MRYNNHWRHEGQHARMSASQHHWINYTPEKFRQTYINKLNADLGTRYHVIAAELIRLGVRQARKKKTFNMYVNDAIGFRMTPEVMVFYSDNAFGTVDAIDYNPDTKILRIHDLKMGTTPCHMNQLYIYAAYFCLEYKVNPFDIETILRIYKDDDITEEIADPSKVRKIMDTTVEYDIIAEELKEVYGG